MHVCMYASITLVGTYFSLYVCIYVLTVFYTQRRRSVEEPDLIMKVFQYQHCNIVCVPMCMYMYTLFSSDYSMHSAYTVILIVLIDTDLRS